MIKKVLVFGTFDIFHPGHESFLKQAREQGNNLTVVVARDSTVEKVKEKKPFNNENNRLKNIQRLKYVDKALLGSESDYKYEIINNIKPDIICLGYDQKAFVSGLAKKIKLLGLNIKIMRLKPYKPHIHKSSHYKPSQKQK